MTHKSSGESFVLEVHPLADHDDGEGAQVSVGEAQTANEEDGPEVVREDPPLDAADDQGQRRHAQHGEDPNVLLRDDPAMIDHQSTNLSGYIHAYIHT